MEELTFSQEKTSKQAKSVSNVSHRAKILIIKWLLFQNCNVATSNDEPSIR